MYLFVCSFFGEYIKSREFCISFYVASTLGVFCSRIGASIIYSKFFKLVKSGKLTHNIPVQYFP